MENKKITGFDYLWIALYACAGFAFELILVNIENMIGIDIKNNTVMPNIIHWLITIIGWILIGMFILKLGKKTTNFDIWEHKEKIKAWQYIALILCFVVNIIVKYMDWNGFKVIIEWNNRGPLLFLFQYLYYLTEGFLISIVIVFGQKAFESWFHNDKIPFGGIILGLTWGIAHIISKGSITTGLLSAGAGFLFGTSYLLVNKDYRKALPIITLLFIL